MKVNTIEGKIGVGDIRTGFTITNCKEITHFYQHFAGILGKKKHESLNMFLKQVPVKDVKSFLIRRCMM